MAALAAVGKIARRVPEYPGDSPRITRCGLIFQNQLITVY